MSANLGTIVFASPFCLIDYSSGAAIASYQSLELLARSGFRCLSYCAARMDFNEEVCLRETLAEMHLPYQVEDATIAGRAMRLVHTRLGAVPVTIFRNQFTRLGPTREEATAFLTRAS